MTKWTKVMTAMNAVAVVIGGNRLGIPLQGVGVSYDTSNPN